MMAVAAFSGFVHRFQGEFVGKYLVVTVTCFYSANAGIRKYLPKMPRRFLDRGESRPFLFARGGWLL